MKGKLSQRKLLEESTLNRNAAKEGTVRTKREDTDSTTIIIESTVREKGYYYMRIFYYICSL